MFYLHNFEASHSLCSLKRGGDRILIAGLLGKIKCVNNCEQLTTGPGMTGGLKKLPLYFHFSISCQVLPYSSLTEWFEDWWLQMPSSLPSLFLVHVKI